MNRLAVFFLLFCAMAGWSCGERRDYTPTEGDRRVIRTYASLALLYDAFSAARSQDSVKLYQGKVDSVLAHFGLSRDEFRREFEDLINTPERLQPLFQELSVEIRKELQKR